MAAVNKAEAEVASSGTLPLQVMFLVVLVLAAALEISVAAASSQTGKGFSVSPSGTTPPPPFQPILQDPSGNFSLGFLLLPGVPDKLDLAVVHVASSVPLWRASPAGKPGARWGPGTSMSFDGRLFLSDPDSGVFWSAQVEGGAGERLVLLSSSNLQILDQKAAVIWQSFDFPSDTIVEDQNLTSASTVVSSANSRYSMRLGSNYLGLYLGSRSPQHQQQQETMYWKQTAMEATAKIVDGKGPIYARVNATGGFLGLYQQEGPPVHVMPFDSFKRASVAGSSFWRLTLESDGNLKGYYWNGTTWVTDFVAIPDTCSLPASCGAYGLCHPEGTGGACGCLLGEGADGNNMTFSGPCPLLQEDSDSSTGDGSDLCDANNNNNDDGSSNSKDSYWVLRRRGVDLSYKEQVGFTKMASVEECEGSCTRNCSCWGAIYSNATGSCYLLDFPIETLVAEGGGGKMGYFKVKKPARGDGNYRRKWKIGVALLVVGTGIFLGISGFGAYRVWSRKKRMAFRDTAMGDEDGMSPVPYKNLKATSSFRSVELSASSSFSTFGK